MRRIGLNHSEMKNSKNKRTIILTIILLVLLVIGYKVIFVSPNDSALVEENTNTDVVKRIESILNEVEQINFSTDIMTDPRFASLKTMEIALPSLPVGKKNPFSAIFD